MLIFNLENIKAEFDVAEPFERDGEIYKAVFLGTVFSLCSSGKYYMPWACSNVTEKEADQDERWVEKAEAELDTIDAFLTSGEGSATDLFAERWIGNV